MTFPISKGPLGTFEKFLLIVSTASIVLLCYLFSVLSIMVLALVVAVEIALMLIFLRFGVGWIFLEPIRHHSSLVAIFVGNLWSNKGVEVQVPVVRADAPKMFDILDSLASRIGIAAPDAVLVEMNCSAWVRLHGYASGRGKTVFGIGYDLLATLNVEEFEAVMAHEMTHAKLVKRGVMSWVKGGLSHIVRLSQALSEFIASCHTQGKGTKGAVALQVCTDKMGRLTARLFAAYSRQDEFEADSGAAQMCGAWALRQSLIRLHAVSSKLNRLPWVERVSRTETEDSFSRWLIEELAEPDSAIPFQVVEEARDPYSTHPSLHDRLAALSATGEPSRASAPAISLLAFPDKLAVALIEETNRVQARQEEKDTRKLARMTRRLQSRSSQLGWKHLPSLLLYAAAGLALIFFVADVNDWVALVTAFVLGLLGFGLFRLVRYRDRRSLPIPRFAELKRSLEAPVPPDLESREKEIESELVQSGAKVKQRVDFLLNDAFASLGRCEYLRAHVATRLALQIDNKCVEAALGNAIASAALGQSSQASNMLTFIQRKAGLASAQIVWGACWSLAALGDWVNAEGFLWTKHREVPNDPVFLALLAFVQRRRGKLQSATINAEKAAGLAPEDSETQKLLCQCLLDAGRIRVAAERLALLEDNARYDSDLAVLMVRLKLLHQDIPSAQKWAAQLHEYGQAASFSEIGGLFEYARQDQLAIDYYNRAAGRGFCPDAQLGLARVFASRKEWSQARKHLRSALNLELPPPIGGNGPAQLFQPVINELMQLERRREQCQAWMMSLPLGDVRTIVPALRGCRMMVFAPTREAATRYVDEVISAMQPSLPFADITGIEWAAAPKDQQPERPVYPGVQGVL